MNEQSVSEEKCGIMTETIRIEKISERRGRFMVEITGLEHPIICSRLLVDKHRLKQGIVLTRPQVELLLKEADLESCDMEASRLLAMRPHSIGEVRQKLKRKRFDPESIRKVVSRYKRLGLLDDAAFAVSLMRRLLERNPAGRSFLLAHLYRKLIDRDLAEQAVAQVMKENDETELACRSLRKRMTRLNQFDLETARRKAYTYLSRRGISYDASRKAFEEVYGKSQEHDED